MKRVSLLILTGMMVLLMCSCSGTKHLKQGEVLYVGSRMIVKKKPGDFKVNQQGRKLAAAYLTVWDLPNGSFGVPFFRFVPSRLLLYNAFYTTKEKGLKHWIMVNFGEEPVLLQDIEPDKKVLKIIEKYEDFGHFGTKGEYFISYNRKKTKAYVHYRIEIPEAFRYRKIEYGVDSAQKHLLGSINEYRKKSNLHSGKEFDMDSLKLEKFGLWNQLRRDGYFYIQESDIEIEGDTTVGHKQVDIRISLRKELSATQLSKVYINTVGVQMDSVVQVPNESKFFNYRAGRFRKSFLDSIVTLRPGHLYRRQERLRIVEQLNSLGVFSSAYLYYTPAPADSSKLDVMVVLNPQKSSNLSANINGNYKTTGYLGPSLQIDFNQINLFGRAENLSLEFNGYYDVPFGVFKERISKSSGFSLRSVLRAPTLNRLLRSNKVSNLPFNFISSSIEYNNRRLYFKMIALSAAYGFNWNTSAYNQHVLKILNVTYSDVYETTNRFNELVANNVRLRNSLIKQLILGVSYNYILDHRRKGVFGEGYFFQGGLELAGNGLRAVQKVAEAVNVNGAINFPFSQFAQLNYDFRWFKRLGDRSMIAFRHLGGFGIPYGNSSVMPYIRQYFIGGTNSLRPIAARAVGPGRYLEFNAGEINQVGDVKLEANLEYRVRLGIRLYGAIWADAGNIWLLNEDPERPGSGIRWNKIFEDSYLTSGIGLRLDLNYIVLRADYGALVYLPVLDKGYRWLFQNKLPLAGYLIGFGFPF